MAIKIDFAGFFRRVFRQNTPQPGPAPQPTPEDRIVAAIVNPGGVTGSLIADSGNAYVSKASEYVADTFNLAFRIPVSETGGATLKLECDGYGPWSGRVTLDPVLGTNFVLRTLDALKPKDPTIAQIDDIQCDLMIWCPEVKPNPDGNGWDAALQIQLNGALGRAHGIEAGWVWCTTIANYPPEKRQIIYRTAKAYGHTHFALHVPQMGPGGGYHGVFPFSQAMSDNYGQMMNTVCAELRAVGLIPLCAGVAPGQPPARGFDPSQVRAAMTDWDNTAEAASRVRAISDAFPNARLFFELAAGNTWPAPSADDPVPPNAGSSNPWIRGMRQKFPRFAGVIHEADIKSSVDDVVALYTKKHGWWHDLPENQGEVDTFDKFWSGMSDEDARQRNDAIAARCPWLKGSMSGWTMRPAPPDEVAPEEVTLQGDAIDPASIAVEGGPADLLQWPATAKITSLELRQGGVHVEFTKHNGTGSWPDFRPTGWDGDLQYSMGLVLQVNGRWYAAAPIQCWRTMPQAGGPIMNQTVDGSAPGQVPRNWYYDQRWPVLRSARPKAGDRVGFFVAAGDIRGGGFTVRERSNIVAFTLPADGTEQSFVWA